MWLPASYLNCLLKECDPSRSQDTDILDILLKHSAKPPRQPMSVAAWFKALVTSDPPSINELSCQAGIKSEDLASLKFSTFIPPPLINA